MLYIYEYIYIIYKAKMEVNLGNKIVNVKTAGKSTLEKVILEIIKTKHPNRESILNYYFKKHKMKPHKKLNNELSFIECSIKYDDHDLLCNYVKNLTLCAPSYNIINLCVEYNKIELLKKYISEKRISIEQCVNENTPLITAIKKKQIECFNILIENNCKLNQPNSKGSSPICNLFSNILIENENGSGGISDENKLIYEKFIDGMLPMKFLVSYEQLKDELKDDLKFIGDKNKKNDYSVFNKLKDDIKILMHKHKMFESDLFEKITDNNDKYYNNDLSDVYYHYINKYNILYSNCETSKLIKMADNGLDSFVNLILNKRPYMLYLNYSDYKVITHLFNSKNQNVINNILTNFSHVVLYDNELLNFLAFTGKMEYVKILLNKYPDCVTQVESSGRTLIEAVAISKNIEEIKKIEYIDYFISMGANVNNINYNQLSTLEVAIQYSTIPIVEHLIKHTSDEFKKRDILDFACCFESVAILKMLVDNDFCIEYCEERNIPDCIYPSLRLSNYPLVKYIFEEPKFKIKESNYKYLFDYAIKYKCTKNILCLLDKEYKLNNDISDNDTLDTFDTSDIKYSMARLNGMFSNFIDKYNYDQCEIISYTKMIIMMLLKIINNDTNKISKSHFFDQEEEFTRINGLLKPENELSKCFMIILTYENITTLTSADISEIFTRAIEGNFSRNAIDSYKNVLIDTKDKLEHFSTILIKLFQQFIDEDDEHNYYCDCCKKAHNSLNDTDTDTDTDTDEYLDYESSFEDIDTSNNKIKKTKNKKAKQNKKTNTQTTIKNITNTKDTKPNSDSENQDLTNEHEQIIISNNKFTMDNEQIIIDNPIVKHKTIAIGNDFITGLLTRLTYPFIMGNYDILKNLLSQTTTYYEDEYKFNIVENNKLIAMVYKNSKEEIPLWIETYGYNICTDNKMDSNHMFTFGIDILLFELWNKKNNAVKCKYKIINTEKHATCIYIYGKALIDGRWERGNFEYFLNDKNILFHRLFKPSQSHFLNCNSYYNVSN